MAVSNAKAVASLQHLAQSLSVNSQLQALTNATSLPGGLQVSAASMNSAAQQLANAAAAQQLVNVAAAQQQRASAQAALQLVAAQQLVHNATQQSVQSVTQQFVSASAAQQLAAQQLIAAPAIHQLTSASIVQQLAAHQLSSSVAAHQLASASAVQQLATAVQQLSSPIVAQHVPAPSVLQLVSAPSTPHLASAPPIQQFATTGAGPPLTSLSASQQLATQLAVPRACPAIAVDSPGQQVAPPNSVIAAPVPPPPPPAVSSSAPSVVQGTSTSSTSAPIDEPIAAEESVAEEVPKCHLHRKLNKACKYCKAHAIFQDLRSKEADQKRMAALEKLKEDSGPKSTGSLKQDDKVPLPNFAQFPATLKDRILNDRFYKITSLSQELPEIKETLFNCDTCEPELRSQNSLDMTPSEFICSVHRLLILKLTEGQLQTLLNHRSRWVRCAGYLFVRLGVSQDRYWELLSDALMDNEEFVPFPNRGGESITEGQYVEQLLTREKYCDFKLPRIETAQRRIINERLVLYEQFRKRYDAHVEDPEHLQSLDEKISVEVCSIDGVWASAETTGPATGVSGRRVMMPVRFSNGAEQIVSLGMIICPDKKRLAASSSSSRVQDLTCDRGRSNEELLEEYRSKQRGNAVASGKDYCKNSGRHMVHAGGVVFMGGDTNKRSREKDDSDSSEEWRGKAKKGAPNREHEVKMAAIVEKYCSRGTTSQAIGQNGNSVDRPDRLRLG